MCQSCVNPILEATNLEPQQMDHVQSLWTREMDHASPKATNFCSFMWLKFEANQASCLFPGIASCRKKHQRIRRKFRIPRFIGPFILELQTMAPAKKAEVFHRKNSTGVQSDSSGHGFDGRWVAWCCLGYSQRMFDDTMSGLSRYMFGEFSENSYWTPKINLNFR